MALHYSKLSIRRPAWLGDGQWILTDLTDITVVFGKNGSGKSLLLRAIFDELKEKSQYISPERAGEVSYQQAIVQEELQASSRGNQRRGKNLATRFRQESISRLGTLKMRIGDVAGRGQSTKAILSKIESDLTTLLPEFKLSIIDSSPLFRLEKQWDDNDLKEIGITQLSSGETEILTLALELLTICNLWLLEKQKQRVLLIDEPDSHLHPDLQVMFADFLIRLADEYNTQIIVATHSTTLMASLGYSYRNKVGIVYLNNSKAEQVIQPFNEYFQKLSVCLGGHALMGPLFNAPLLLVEGDDDYQVWSHLPRNPKFRNALSVLPCEGESIKQYQKLLEKLFASLRNSNDGPIGYALLDKDKKFPSNSKQENIKFVQLNCHELENLYLSDEVLNKLGYTWSEAIENIEQSASNYGNKAKQLENCKNWDRQNEDLKTVIVEIAQILDPKGLNWTMRLGKILSDRKPIGQLAEFLGEEVINAVWVYKH